VFPGFDPSLFDDPDFKEDSVREVVIAPMLARLGFVPTGDNRVVRSKSLTHPFIYAGTRKVPVRLVPDYSLLSGGRTVLVLDAKAPREDVLSRENVQQAYSYAIHPEIKCDHFALCNGRRLVLFHVDSSTPILTVDFQEYEKRWEEIERYLTPRMLREPILRRYAPDFGCAIARLGLGEGSGVSLFPARFNIVARIDDSTYSASANTDFAGRQHCVSFDFDQALLPAMLAGLHPELSAMFIDALKRAPFSAAAELSVEVDLITQLGPEIVVSAETFRPLIIQEVLASRFDPTPLEQEATDIPRHVFRLRNAFTVRGATGDL
jgi:hypothetical protein